MNLQTHTTTKIICNAVAIKISYINYENMLTFRKEHRNHKSKADGGHSIGQQEHEQYSGGCVADDAAVGADVDVEKDCHDGDGHEEEEVVLGEPGQPVQPVAQTHHLHGFLAGKCQDKVR